MKLVHPGLEGQIIFDIQKTSEWIIESPNDFYAYTRELFQQSEGAEGRFVLSENDKEIEISKFVEVIFNPFAVNINDRKILNKLYSELSEIASGEEMFMETQAIKNNLLTYFLKVEYISSYILEPEPELDILAVFKAMGIRFGEYADDFIGNLNQYIKIMAELMRKKVIVLVNIRSYINDSQLGEVIQNAMHNEIAILLIENMQRELSDRVYRYIIDKDSCEIF